MKLSLTRRTLPPLLWALFLVGGACSVGPDEGDDDTGASAAESKSCIECLDLPPNRVDACVRECHPERDDDKDGFVNGLDRCPTVAGSAKHCGCPPGDENDRNRRGSECPELRLRFVTLRPTGRGVTHDGRSVSEDRGPSRRANSRENLPVSSAAHFGVRAGLWCQEPRAKCTRRGAMGHGCHGRIRLRQQPRRHVDGRAPLSCPPSPGGPGRGPAGPGRLAKRDGGGIRPGGARVRRRRTSASARPASARRARKRTRFARANRPPREKNVIIACHK